jgi:hypothetical protein
MFDTDILTDDFLELIVKQGAEKLWYNQYTADIAIGSCVIEVYKGINDQAVFINVSRQYIDPTTAKDHLHQLGMDYLLTGQSKPIYR